MGFILKKFEKSEYNILDVSSASKILHKHKVNKKAYLNSCLCQPYFHGQFFPEKRNVIL